MGEIIDHENEEEETPEVPIRRPESKTVARKTARRIQDLIPELPSDKYLKASKKSKKHLKTSSSGKTRMMSRSMRNQPIQQPRSKSFRSGKKFSQPSMTLGSNVSSVRRRIQLLRKFQ